VVGQPADREQRTEDGGQHHAHGGRRKGVDQPVPQRLRHAGRRVEQDRPPGRLQLAVDAQPPQGQTDEAEDHQPADEGADALPASGAGPGQVEQDARAAHRTIATRFSTARINQAEGSVMIR
jgi:hypothetical protein